MAQNKAEKVKTTALQLTPTPAFKVGDNVTVRGSGNRKSNGTGWVVVEESEAIRRISNVLAGMNYPYEIGDPYGSVIGYFREESITLVK